MRRLPGALYLAQAYLVMALLALPFTPLALWHPRYATLGVQVWCRYARWSLRLIGLTTRIRGPVPKGDVLIAAKHQSFLDIILLVSVLDRPRFVMKRALLFVPILGWYARRMGCVPIDRTRGADALRSLNAMPDTPGQLVIYPQGTRTPPRADRPYKPGLALLAARLNRPVIPVATNAGLFWPRAGIPRGPGIAIVEFLPPLPAGQPKLQLMDQVKARIEPATRALESL